MKRKPYLRLSALLLAVCLLCTLLPVQAGAVDSDVTYRVEGDTLIYSGTGMLRTQDLAPEDVRSQVKHIIVEPGITKITAMFMRNSENLETVTLPEGLTVIQMDTFRGCTSLRSINIPSTVTTIQNYALSGLKSLERVELPAGLTSLGESAFSSCKSLKQVVVPGGIVELKDNTFAYCEAMEDVVISRGVLSIGNAAFAGNYALKRVSLPDTLMSIGASAFNYCSSLEEITLPASLTSLDYRAFLNCTNLKKITFLGTQGQWDAFEPLVITMRTSWWETSDYFTGEVECLGTGESVTTTVTFDANGGTVSQTQKDVVYGENYGELPVPVNGDRPFFGWFTQPEGGECVNAFNQMVQMEGHTLYAHWGSGSTALTPAVGQAPDLFSTRRTGDHVIDYLYANEKGGLTRVQANTSDKQVIVNELNGDFNLQARMTIPFELPIWGGFFAGDRYNFLIFGQTNPDKSSEQEVLRVVKYDKNWERVDSASVYGAYTMVPFHAGRLECAEEGDFLVLHTCHQMYDEHQANMTFIFRQSNMTKTFARTGISNEKTGYVSHSFHQEVLVDSEGRLVTLDHGDACPRALALNRYDDEVDFETGELIESPDLYLVQEFLGELGNNFTGCSTGGLAETANSYLVAYLYDPSAFTDRSQPYDIYVQFVDKETLTGQSVRLSTGGNVGIPVVAPLGLDGGYIIWSGTNEAEGALYYARYSADGTVGTVQTAEGRLSDCKPVVYQGKLVWYVTMYNRASRQNELRFYTLDPNTETVTYKDSMMIDTESAFLDVKPSDYFYSAVQWAVGNGITNGTSATTFSPDTTCSHVEIITFLWRANGKPAANAAAPVQVESYFQDAVNWAYGEGIIDGNFNPSAPCTRADTVTYMWKAKGSPTADGGKSFSDVPAGADYLDAVNWAVAQGVTTGTNDGSTFEPGTTCSRAQIVTFLNRAYSN